MIVSDSARACREPASSAGHATPETQSVPNAIPNSMRAASSIQKLFAAPWPTSDSAITATATSVTRRAP